jgi:FKBP-type peptidyl-prolyl cis-trans isomerase SlyD
MPVRKSQKLSRTAWTKECNLNIAKDKMVSIHYTLKDAEGNLIDSSVGHEPLEYLHGNGNLIPGLESQLEGKAAGEKFTAAVEAKDAYGEYDEHMVVEVPRSQFDADAPIEVGMKFQADTQGGPMIVRVTKVTDDTITVDGNHELAGKKLFFDVEVVNVRDATEEELKPQSCGGSCGNCGGGCEGGCGEGSGEGCGCEGGCCGN